MTLIRYLTRVHFADGVLEEALRAEMERHGKRRPLIVVDADGLTGAVAERFFSSLPIRCRAETFADAAPQPTETAAARIRKVYLDGGCDLLIAYGSSRAIDLAKAARVAIAYDEPIAAFSDEEGGGQRIDARLPDLYAIPGVLGFASAISDFARVRPAGGGQIRITSAHLLPTVTICDPTLTQGASRTDSAGAAAGILARGVDAALSPNYNPPADGLALDALKRVGDNLADALDDRLSSRREMMAGGLNSSLALQKGPGAIHAICDAIASTADVEPGALGGVVTPALVRFYGDAAGCLSERIKPSLGIAASRGLGDGLAEMLGALPLPRRLGDLGVEESALPGAAAAAARDRAIRNGPRALSESDVLEILEAVH